MIEKSMQDVLGRSWDVVIVGAGTVGLLAAAVLVGKGFKVLCLESGSTIFDAQAQSLNEATMLGEKHLGVSNARARIVGGTSTLWGGQLARFTKADFDRVDDNGNKRWPLFYDDIEPWYLKVANLLGLTSYDSDQESTLAKIFEGNIPNTDDIEFYVTHWLREPNIYRYFSSKISSNSDFSICINAHVISLDVSDESSKIAQITILNEKGERHHISAKAYILANGTMEISRLLLASAAKDPRVSWASNQMVGCFFQDHIDIECGEMEMLDEGKLSRYFENAIVNGCKVQPKIRLTQDNLSKIGMLNVGGAVRFDSELLEDINCIKTMVKSIMQGGVSYGTIKSVPKHFKGVFKVWWPLTWNYIRNRRIKAFWDKGVFLIAHMEQTPLFHSKIILDQLNVDRFGEPRLSLDWHIDWELQMKSLQHFCASASEFFLVNKLAKFKPNSAILNGDIGYLKSNARDSYHQCGGAIMSRDASGGVVDVNCRIYGTSNLYIAGASVFPTSSYANPTFTAMALAYRMAEHIDV